MDAKQEIEACARYEFGANRSRFLSTLEDRISEAESSLGGFPYAFALLATLKSYLEGRGFSVVNARCNRTLGCSELVVQRASCAG